MCIRHHVSTRPQSHQRFAKECESRRIHEGPRRTVWQELGSYARAFNAMLHSKSGVGEGGMPAREVVGNCFPAIGADEFES